jgi:hypothetical protein
MKEVGWLVFFWLSCETWKDNYQGKYDTILDIIHHPVFHLKTRRFGDWVFSPSLGVTHSEGKRW